MRRLAVLVALAAAAALAPAAGAATIDVRIEQGGFAPASLTIAAGDTIRWTNRTGGRHQVVSETGAFASPTLAADQSYSFAFETAGTFRYRDGLKPAERGTVRVIGPPPGLTLAAAAPIVVYGAVTRLRGTVSSGQPGETVIVQQAPYGSSGYTQLVVTTTGTGGVFDVGVQPTVLTSYVAQWKGATSAEVQVQVRPKLTLLPGRRGWFLARASAAGSFAGRDVYLQRRSGFGQWVSVARLRLGPASGKLFRAPPRTGMSTYRVFMTINQAGAGYLEGWSGTQTVRRG